MNLQKELDNLSNFDDISYDADATIVTGESAKNVFCNGWPSTKVVLEAVAVMIKNPIVKIIIGIVVKAGDALSAKICD